MKELFGKYKKEMIVGLIVFCLLVFKDLLQVPFR